MAEGTKSYEAECEEVFLEATRSRSVTIRLAVPVKRDGVDTSELVLRRFTIGQWRRIQREKPEEYEEIHLVAKSAGMKPEDVEEMDPADFNLCARALAGFLSGRVSSAE